METIKEEKKADLEQLLNSLIKRGRVPFGDKRITNVSWKLEYEWVGTYGWVFWSNHNLVKHRKSTRELVSKESGLWQFVCENGMRPKRPGYEEHIWQRDGKTNGDRCILENEYQYYLIESALCDEDKLEDFILDNIKVDETK